MLHEFLEIIDGRKVAIVGNGEVAEDKSAEIDSADIVIRFNHFYNYDSGKVGKKVDVIIQTFTGAWVNSKNKHEDVIRAQMPKIFNGKRPELYNPAQVADFLSPDICISDLYPELEPYTRFTTGGAFLAWISSKKRNAEFKVYGFPRGEAADKYFATDAKHYAKVKDEELAAQTRAISILEQMRIEKPREERKSVVVVPFKAKSEGAPRKNDILMPKLLAKIKDLGYRIVLIGDGEELGEKMKAEFGVDFYKTPAATTGEVTDDLRLWRDMTDYHGEIIYLQCTSPKLKVEWIDKCLEARKCAPVSATCVKLDFKVNGIFGCANGVWAQVVTSFGAPSVPRQRLPECVHLTGAVFAFHSDALSRASFYQAGSLRPVIVDEEDALDVDTQKDLEKAKEA